MPASPIGKATGCGPVMRRFDPASRYGRVAHRKSGGFQTRVREGSIPSSPASLTLDVEMPAASIRDRVQQKTQRLLSRLSDSGPRARGIVRARPSTETLNNAGGMQVARPLRLQMQTSRALAFQRTGVETAPCYEQRPGVNTWSRARGCGSSLALPSHGQ